MKLKHLFLAIAVVLVISGVARADGGSGDLVIAVNGAFTTTQGEAFAVSYEAVLCCSNSSAENYNLVPGTLTYSSSGPLGTVTSVGGVFPEGAEWQFSGGDAIELMLFRTPGCGAPGVECQPEVGPDEVFPAGYTNAQVNAFANGIFEILPPGQYDGPAYFGDVQVSLAGDPVSAPEPSSLLMLVCGMLVCVALARTRAMP